MMGRSTQIRPKYQISTKLSPDVITDGIQSLLETTNSIQGRVIDNNVYLKLPEDEQYYWSPELHVRIGKRDNGSLIKGLAGPNPKIWATFMVFYGLAIMLLIFGGSLGISQLMLGIDSIWIWSVPISILLFVLIFIAAKYGQRLGDEQFIQLRDFLDKAIESAEMKHKTLT